MNQLNCLNNLSNTGLSGCTENLGYFAKLLWLKDDFTIATEALAQTESTWTDAIDAHNVYPFPLFKMVEPQNEDDLYESLPAGFSEFVREGKIGEKGSVNLAMCNLQKLRTFNEVKGKLALVTSNGYIVMYSPDGTTLQGFSLDQFHVGGIGTTDGTTKRKTPITWKLSDPMQMNDYGAAIKPTWNPLDLAGVLDVTVAVVGTATNALVTFSVTRDCDGEGVEGLVAADFAFLVAAGTAQSGGTWSEVGNGVYKETSSGTTFITGTIDLLSPTAQTTGGYESAAPASYTI